MSAELDEDLKRSHLAIALDIDALRREVVTLRERIDVLDRRVIEYLEMSRKHLLGESDV